MRIKYYAIYDTCGKGHIGNANDGFPIGSYIYFTQDKTNAEKVLKIINNCLPEYLFKATIAEKELILDEPKYTTEEEIIKWYKSN